MSIQNIFYVIPHPDCSNYYTSPLRLMGDQPLVERLKPQGGSSSQSVAQNKVICALWLRNMCERDSCGFAHSFNGLVPEPLPQNYKKNPCKSYFDQGCCTFQFNCKYYHRNDFLYYDGKLVTAWTPDPLNPPYWVVYRIFEVNQ